jgi:hypothetical protein
LIALQGDPERKRGVRSAAPNNPSPEYPIHQVLIHCDAGITLSICLVFVGVGLASLQLFLLRLERIANTDRHFGNLAFYDRYDGRFALAPVLDTLPCHSHQNMIKFWLAYSLRRVTNAAVGSFGRVGTKPQCLRIAEFLRTFGVNPIGLRARKGAHTARI